MNGNKPDGNVYVIGIFIGFLIGMFVMYMNYVKHNLLLPEDKYVCVGAEPLGTDPSIVACTILLRKDSEAHKKFTEMNSDGSV